MKFKVVPEYKFRLHISKKHFGLGGYFTVNIWSKKKLMQEAVNHTSHASTTFSTTPSGNDSKIITLNFWKKRLGIEYVIHELLHAMLEWSRCNNLKVQYYEDKFYRDEELFAQISGELSKQFYRKLFRLGLTEQMDFVESREFRK